MSWLLIVATILSVVGPYLLGPQLKWLEQLLMRVGRDMQANVSLASPSLYDSKAGIKMIFTQAYAEMSWWDWIWGKGILLSRIEKVVLDKADEIWEYQKFPSGKTITPLTAEQADALRQLG